MNKNSKSYILFFKRLCLKNYGTFLYIQKVIYVDILQYNIFDFISAYYICFLHKPILIHLN